MRTSQCSCQAWAGCARSRQRSAAGRLPQPTREAASTASLAVHLGSPAPCTAYSEVVQPKAAPTLSRRAAVNTMPQATTSARKRTHSVVRRLSLATFQASCCRSFLQQRIRACQGPGVGSTPAEGCDAQSRQWQMLPCHCADRAPAHAVPGCRENKQPSTVAHCTAPTRAPAAGSS